MHHNWNGKQYEGDVFPSHFTEEQKKECHKRYKNIPEEFYTKTKRFVVTPENFKEWFAAHKHLKIVFHLQEQMSGSGRVSYVAYATGLSVLFPMDLRYGWDLTLPAHRKMLEQVQNHFKPIVAICELASQKH